MSRKLGKKRNEKMLRIGKFFLLLWWERGSRYKSCSSYVHITNSREYVRIPPHFSLGIFLIHIQSRGKNSSVCGEGGAHSKSYLNGRKKFYAIIHTLLFAGREGEGWGGGNANVHTGCKNK